VTLKRAELLEVADVAYHNVVETGIGPALAAAGYTEERRQAGLQQAAALQAGWEELHAARGRQFALTQQVLTALTARRRELIALKQAVRAADYLTGSDLYTRLNLKGHVAKSYSGFVAVAQTVYGALLADDAMLQAIAGFGYTRARVAGLVQGISDLEALNRQQEKAKGDYRRLTQEVQALVEVVWDDLRALKAVVKTLFADEAAQQVITSLRLKKI
jgi:hypothetical protein